MSQANILLVDDDVELAEILREYLQGEGFAVGLAHDGVSGVGEALSGRHDLVVLDVMMPRISGIEVLKQVRGESRIPVLMLTAKGDEIDRVVGLELGADDYVPKPCSGRELAARIRAILRRTQPAVEGTEQNDALRIGQLIMYPGKREAELDGKALKLTSTEFNLLELLTRHAGRVVSKQALSEQGLGRPLAQYDRSIDVHLANIRRKLEELGDGREYIKTVIRRGYQLMNE